LTVYLVDGNYVRARYYVDFTMDGHDRVYPEFIPPGEGWLDDAVPPDERGYVLRHMIEERARMRAGQSYDAAHEAVSVTEQARRREDISPHPAPPDLGKAAPARAAPASRPGRAVALQGLGVVSKTQLKAERALREAWMTYMAGLRRRIVEAMEDTGTMKDAQA
jgi:hypothetical protein